MGDENLYAPYGRNVDPEKYALYNAEKLREATALAESHGGKICVAARGTGWTVYRVFEGRAIFIGRRSDARSLYRLVVKTFT